MDPSQKELAFAKEQVEQAKLQAQDFIVGDARDLAALASQAFNAVLFLGPLIHLTERAERAKALAELGRVLEPGGVAIVSYLNSWGLVPPGVGQQDGPRFKEIALLRMVGTFRAKLSVLHPRCPGPDCHLES